MAAIVPAGGGPVPPAPDAEDPDVKPILTTSLLVATLAVAGCGHSRGDRAVSGGLIGAGAGAAISGLTGGSLGTGALIGGAVGAAGGALTSGRNVNMGRPVWR